MMDKTKKLFLVCPIGKEDSETRRHADTVLKHLIEDTIERFQELSSIEVVRADKLGQPGKITIQIMTQLTDSDIVVADLTGLNPNVLYEVGIRQAILKPYILIAEVGTSLPFDLKDSRTIFYDVSSLDSMSNARQELKKHIEKALAGHVDPYDEEIFGIQERPRRVRAEDEQLDFLRLIETLDGIIEAEKSTSLAVDALSHRFSQAVHQIESLFTTGYGGAGSYLYISGENEAFSALVAALSRAKKSVRTTRYSPYAVGTRQVEFAQMIRSRVMGDVKYPPVQSFIRIVAANNITKIKDVKEYIDEFIGKSFTLYLTPYTNNFELVIIDNEEVFIHFHGREKIIDSTLHIIGEAVAQRFSEIYAALHDPLLQRNVKKIDFKYISRQEKGALMNEIYAYFEEYCGEIEVDDALGNGSQ